MALQKLEGILVTPKGTANIARFGRFERSAAFGGYIFNANVEVGFSNQPTQITLSIVLEAKDKNQISAVFDINDLLF